MATKKVLVYGGRGALGSVIVSHFKSLNYWVGSIDLAPNDNADYNLLISEKTWTGQETEIAKLDDQMQDAKLDGIFCVAGGWAGGNAASAEFVKSCDMMWQQSVWSSILAAQIAAKHLKEGGVLTLTGAQPALSGTSGMIGYGMAKGAVHQLVASLAQEKSGLPGNSFVAAILPVTLDTPMNRKWMPDADQSKWTPLEFVAGLFAKWSDGEERPANGSLLQLITKEGDTSLVAADK